MSYRVFIRNWWRVEPGSKRLVPNSGAKGRTVQYVETEAEAKQMCREHNTTHEPGRLSCKMEYSQS